LDTQPWWLVPWKKWQTFESDVYTDFPDFAQEPALTESKIFPDAIRGRLMTVFFCYNPEKFCDTRKT
jgi:hypothetical protein